MIDLPQAWERGEVLTCVVLGFATAFTYAVMAKYAETARERRKFTLASAGLLLGTLALLAVTWLLEVRT